MTFSDMTVQGYVVSSDIQKEALRRFMRAIRKVGKQRAATMEGVLSKLGVPISDGVCYRTSNRILQKARKQGVISFSGIGWSLGDNAKQVP